MTESTSFRAAVIDDEKDITISLSRILEKQGYDVTSYLAGEGFLQNLKKEAYDLIFLDVNLGLQKLSGIDILKILKEKGFSGHIIIISGNADISTAVEALKLGAGEFLEKPFNLKDVQRCIKQFEKSADLLKERDSLLSGIMSRYELIGSSFIMESVRKQIVKVALLKEPVLITGESGTGKELAANSLHYYSQRRGKTLYRINIAAITDSLLESQLFGYEKGAFSGAESSSPGLFKAASGSSLFLDEIGEMDVKLQAKLLRVVQEQEVLPMGTSDVLSVDTRCIFATNRNLPDEVRAGNFREDLFYRISTFEITMPPLRDHREDIPQLAEKILMDFSFENNLPCKKLDPIVLEKLSEFPFPGNIRQLKNMLIKALIESGKEDLIKPEHLVLEPGKTSQNISGIGSTDLFWETSPLAEKKRALERLYIQTQLNKHGGDLKSTAASLGLVVNNLYRKLKEYGINP